MAQGQISLEALVRLPRFWGATPSWRGEKIAFYWNKTGREELYTLDLETRQVRQITHGELPITPRSSVIWTRDDASLIFGKDAGGNEQSDLYAIDLETGAVRQLTENPSSVEHALEAHPDGRTALISSTLGGQQNLHALDLGTLEWRRLTDYRAPVLQGRWNPDGTRVSFSTNETDNPLNRDAYIAHADGSEARKVLCLKAGSQDDITDWSPDAQTLAIQSDFGASWRAGVMNLETLEPRWFTEAREDVAEYARRFSPDGAWLLVMRDSQAAQSPVLYRVADGQERALSLPRGFFSTAHFVLGGTHLLLGLTRPTSPGEYLLYDLERDRFEVLLSQDDGSIDRSLFIEPEYLHYVSFDGSSVPALLYAPRDLKPRRRYPALVVVHGGPTSHYTLAFHTQAQFLADRGYVLLLPNFRGSTGYGVRWRDANLRDWGGGDLEDVAHGAAFLKTLSYVDPDRIGITGVSFGGYMSYIAAVKKPELFKVSIPVVGITDLHTLYEDNVRLLPALGYYFHRMMGDPVQNAELWRDRSAITHAANLQAKMLMIHGRNDPRCPLNQAESFRAKLLEQGRVEGQDFEYHVFDDGHGTSDNESNIAQWRLLEAFLERWL
jgi:dipeptidyl aminopeptidase/acylaminoacyl peptidase